MKQLKMETIEEQQSKCGEMSISPSPSPENLRICLVGDVADDVETVTAAQSFGVPIITSETGLDIINDYDWRTYFIIKDFESPVYDAIHRSKQCIMGPPALRRAAEMKDGLTHNARPIYNYSMRGVVTCFTGIRKKDELTKLVNLIHSMGGCIRKDMNSKITHLISSHSGGDKYQYAKTFRLTVVRPAWVFAAWERRNELQFRATTEDFSKEHKLKAFEGQKICFFGFPADEHQHMLDVLQSNGGVPTELDDPECSHVVMPNSGGYFPDTISNTSPNSPKPTSNLYSNSSNVKCQMLIGGGDMQVAETSAAEVEELQRNNQNKLKAVGQDDIDDRHEDVDDYDDDDDNVDDEDDDHFDACLFAEDDGVTPLCDDLDANAAAAQDFDTNASTPKPAKMLLQQELPTDGIVLSSSDTVHEFQTANNNISPILGALKLMNTDVTAMDIDDIGADEAAHNDFAEDEEDQFLLDDQNDLKRKRESFDSVSLMSVDSFALPTSTKKPKLIRAGSITRSIKRSMSFVAVRTPIAKMLRPRRSSVALETAPPTSGYYDGDASICSTVSVESSSLFNESIRKPVKEKLRGLRDRLTRSSSKKDKVAAHAAPKTPEKDQNQLMNQTDDDGFKTPKAPAKYAAVTKTTPLYCSKSSAAVALQQQQLVHSLSATTTSTFIANINSLPTSKTTNRVIGGASNTLCFSSTNTLSSSSAFIASATSTAISSTSSINSVGFHCNQDQFNQLASSVAANAMQYEDTTSNCSHNAHNDVGQTHPNTTVVDEHFTQAKPEPKNNRTHILKSDWFWYTIQNGYADEMDYLFGDYLDSIANTPNTDRRDSLPISFNKRKRKRFSQRLQLEGTPIGSSKRRSSVSDAGLFSVSASFFDCTTSPDKLDKSGGNLLNEAETSTCEQTPANKSMRFNHFMDFFSTESNYVGILDTIVNLFKNPLEELAETNDALLNKSEIKAIFGNFLPIHEVHQHMLERLRTLHSKWQEDCLIGEIILQYRDDLIKAYPPYVNFFEQMKEMLQYCDVQNPRFHAFLKINQTKPECGRQSLQDLMIRPVQRLPSISLLLNDILKHTNKNNADYVKLEEALKAIKEVMAHINEDKRKTESRMAIFDIFNDIEGCPAHLVSSNRSFISKCEVTELSDNLSGRGDSLLLYLFSDSIEVCKKRSRGFNSAKSPSTTKSHKHIKLMSLNAIRFVIDITDSPRAFAMLFRQDKDKLHSFTISDEEVDKCAYVKTLCKQMAENACRTDTDKALLFRTSQELEVDISDVNLSTLSKAFKLAARTRMKVGRAFSFNKTPSKLKRAVSTMMTSPFGSTNSLTPASQLAQMRLASCNNIHEVSDEHDSRSSSPSSQSSDAPVAPMSVQPMRKNKASTLSVGRL